MKRITLFTLVVLSLKIFAGGEVGGAGLAEKNVVFGYLNLSTYIRLCLNSELCRLTTEEKTLLNRIHKSLPKELPADKALIFKTGQEENFFIDGNVRIAKTLHEVATPIYVNKDLLYVANRYQEAKPLTVSGAVALLIHELGHHQGEKDHVKLDVLGSKVQSLTQAQTMSLSARGELKALKIDITDIEAPNSFSQVLISDSYSTQDISKDVKAAADKLCKGVGTSFPGAGPSNYIKALSLWNPHWSYGWYASGGSLSGGQPIPSSTIRRTDPPSAPSAIALNPSENIVTETSALSTTASLNVQLEYACQEKLHPEIEIDRYVNHFIIALKYQIERGNVRIVSYRVGPQYQLSNDGVTLKPEGPMPTY